MSRILVTVVLPWFAVGCVGEEESPVWKPSAGSETRVAPVGGAPLVELNVGNGTAVGGGGFGSSRAARESLERALLLYREQKEPAVLADIAALLANPDAGYEAPMFAILADWHHPLIESAIAVAGEAADEDMRPALEKILNRGPAHLQELALTAAHRIRPWDMLELEDFIFEGALTHLRAVLPLCENLDDRPSAAILGLFAHSDPGIRESARKVLSSRTTEPERDLLRLALRDGTEQVQRLALRVLVDQGVSEKTETALMTSLTSGNRSLREAIYRALAKKRGRLTAPEKVWSVARSRDMALPEQALALMCLERTGSYVAAELQRAVDRMHPLPKYHAARCLLSGGHAQGARAIVEVIATLEADGGHVPVVVEARALLGTLSGLGRYAKVEAMRAWAAGLKKLEPRALPASRIEIAPR